MSESKRSETDEQTSIHFKQTFCDYATKCHLDQILEVLAEPDPTSHYSVLIDFTTFHEENYILAPTILTDAEATIPLCDEGLILAQKNILENSEHLAKKLYTLKPNIHARFTGMSCVPEFPTSYDLGLFLKVTGTVVKVTLPKLLEYKRTYRCSKCSLVQNVNADFHESNEIRPPASCPSDCLPAIFVPVKDDVNYKDYQELKIQEELGKMRTGSIPRSIWAAVDNDLVDKFQPGNHVRVWGTVMRRWKFWRPQDRTNAEVVIKANNVQISTSHTPSPHVTVEVHNKFTTFWEDHKAQPLVGRDLILASFCPAVYGLYLAKLAMCVVLAGGVAKVEEGGNFVRSESHLLLVGDPGTGKSHLLRFAARVAARGVLTTGVGSTSAGLTVAAVREGSDWQLEAGALVLADEGVCCIDELNSIREQDRTSIHEAMEQQTISVAKASIVTKLHTRCSIIAATNAKGQYDPSESICVNVALASPLLSRFDLILILQDTRNEDWDRLMSSFILEVSDSSVEPCNELWSVETLRSYFSEVKKYQPVMSKAANMVLCRYYQAQRGADSRSAARTTVRMLESLVRLSQGHARLMMHTEVTLMDAVVAVTLVECSMASSALISAANALHAAFPSDPHQQLRRQAELILTKLGLVDLIADELSKLDENCPLQPKQKENLATMSSTPSKLPLNPESEIQISQRLTSILSNIKKTRKTDRSSNEVKARTLKRRREPADNEMNKRLTVQLGMTVCDRDITEENDVKDEQDLFCGVIDGESILEDTEQRDLTIVNDTSDAERQVPDSCKEGEIVKNRNSAVKQTSEIRKEIISGNRCIQPSRSIINRLSKWKFSGRPKGLDEEGQEERKEAKEKENFICDKVVISSTPLTRNENSVIVPSMLLTNGGRPVERHFDCDKLKALARVGKALSQSQSCSRISSQVLPVEKEPSEFVLSEISWDDITGDI